MLLEADAHTIHFQMKVGLCVVFTFSPKMLGSVTDHLISFIRKHLYVLTYSMTSFNEIKIVTQQHFKAFLTVESFQP
jgi:hypothetical protein